MQMKADGDSFHLCAQIIFEIPGHTHIHHLAVRSIEPLYKKTRDGDQLTLLSENVEVLKLYGAQQ